MSYRSKSCCLKRVLGVMDPTANDDPVDVAALMSGWGARGQALVDAAPADEPADDEGE